MTGISILLLLVYVAFVTLVVWLVLLFVYDMVDAILDWREARRQGRTAAIEAEFDAAEADLRHAVLALAEQLTTDRDEASRALTRAAYLASGTVNRVE